VPRIALQRPGVVLPDKFALRIKADMQKWAKVVHDAGSRP
jgi:hypothetical protein